MILLLILSFLAPRHEPGTDSGPVPLPLIVPGSCVMRHPSVRRFCRHEKGYRWDRQGCLQNVETGAVLLVMSGLRTEQRLSQAGVLSHRVAPRSTLPVPDPNDLNPSQYVPTAPAPGPCYALGPARYSVPHRRTTRLWRAALFNGAGRAPSAWSTYGAVGVSRPLGASWTA